MRMVFKGYVVYLAESPAVFIEAAEVGAFEGVSEAEKDVTAATGVDEEVGESISSLALVVLGVAIPADEAADAPVSPAVSCLFLLL